MKKIAASMACSLSLLCALPAHAGSPDRQLQQLRISTEPGSTARLSSTLIDIASKPKRRGLMRARSMSSPYEEALGIRNGYVLVTAYGSDPNTLRAALEEQGLISARTHATSVSGLAPIDSIDAMAGITGLTYMKQSFPETQAGLTTSQGDKSMYADLARQQFGVDGSGVRIGVISDSYNCLRRPDVPGTPFTTAEDDIRNGDLPADVDVVAEHHECDDNPALSDEGRAMMQIIHDVAPGAALSFYSGFRGEEDFAQGVFELAARGAQIIVDDISYLNAAAFENNVIARAINTVKAQGVVYFSSAGNQGRNSYEAAFRPAPSAATNGIEHNFNPGSSIDTRQHMTLQGTFYGSVHLSWDEPSISANGIKGSAVDLDIVFYDMEGQPIPVCSDEISVDVCQVPGLARNIGLDATETAAILDLRSDSAPLELQMGIEARSNATPTRIKYQTRALIAREYDTHSPTIYGHANAEGAEAVGAAWWFDTAAFDAANHPICGIACVNSYSSAGGTPLLIDDQGERRTTPFIGFKPGITGPDAGNTTFFGTMNIAAPGEPDAFPNFQGTSASAPHVAAVAALILDQRARDIAANRRFNGPKTLSPDAIISILRDSADDILHRAFDPNDAQNTRPIPDGKGFDFDSGFGMVNALKALELARSL